MTNNLRQMKYKGEEASTKEQKVSILAKERDDAFQEDKCCNKLSVT